MSVACNTALNLKCHKSCLIGLCYRSVLVHESSALRPNLYMQLMPLAPCSMVLCHNLGEEWSWSKLLASPSTPSQQDHQPTTLPARWQAMMDSSFAHSSYLANCGHGDVEGDGVCPVETALLPGAEHVVWPGIWHTEKGPGKLWYGSEQVVEWWDEYLP